MSELTELERYIIYEAMGESLGPLDDAIVTDRIFTGAGFFTDFTAKNCGAKGNMHVSSTYEYKEIGIQHTLFFVIHSVSERGFILEGVTIEKEWPLEISIDALVRVL